MPNSFTVLAPDLGAMLQFAVSIGDVGEAGTRLAITNARSGNPDIPLICLQVYLRHYYILSFYATWSDEDYIGRVPRTARTNYSLTQAVRTLQKSLGQYARQMNC